LHPSGVD